MTWATLVSEERNGISLDRKESSEVSSINSGLKQRSTLRCDKRAGNRSIGEGKSHKLAKREARPSPERPPVGESQSNGIIETCGGGSLRARQETLKSCAGTPCRGQSPRPTRHA